MKKEVLQIGCLSALRTVLAADDPRIVDEANFLVNFVVDRVSLR